MDKLVIAAKKDLLERKKKIKAEPNQFVGTSNGNLSIYVTPMMIPRSLKLMDSLIQSFKKKRYQIGFKEFYGTIVIVDGIKFPIRLREKCRRIKKDDNIWTTSDLLPICKLVFTVDAFPRKEWEDSKKKALDLKIPNIINYLEQKAKEEIQYKIEREKRDKKREIQRKLDEEQRNLKEKEQQKFNDLLEASERWHQAKKLREYIKAVENRAMDKGKLSLELSNWLEWANEKVDDIDFLKNCIN